MKDVFICHASEDKDIVVQPLVTSLQKRGITYWLDEAEILWGDSLIEKINGGLKESRFVIVIMSKSFIAKNWPKREFFSALNIEATKGQVKVLPLIYGPKIEVDKIIEDYPILNDKSYLTWDNNPEFITDLLEMRLSTGETKTDNLEKVGGDIYIPPIRKAFTQRDKDLFIRSAFEVIGKYFEHGLLLIHNQYPEIETTFVLVHAYKFHAKIYKYGEINNECLIWLGGLFGQNSISYKEGHSLSFDESSMNESVGLESDDYNIYLTFTDFGFLNSELKTTSPQKAAERLWKRFTVNL